MVTRHEIVNDPRARRAARTARASGIDVVELDPGDGEPPSAHAFGGFGPRGPLVATTAKLVRAARGRGHFDIVHANDFDTLPAGWWIARRSSARLVYDSHEIYTAQEADPPRLHRLATGMLERVLARRANAVVTVNTPIATELEARL